MACGCGSSSSSSGCGCSSCTDCNCPEMCTAVYTQNSFNIPACDGQAIVDVPKLKTIIVGAYLWNPTYGYFLITSFNALTGQVYITNECTTGNAAPGTIVPACTQFSVSPLPLAGACEVLRGCISVADTSSVDMSYDSGTGVISAVAEISADANNTISIHADGLYGSPATLGNFVQGPAPGRAALGATIVTNGDFTVSLAGWTVVGADWTWNAGKAKHTVGTATSISQNISVTANVRYLIQYTVSGAMLGTFAMYVAGNLVTNHNTSETADAGTWYGSFIAGATGIVLFQITPDVAFDASFDDISIKPVQTIALPAFTVADDTGNPYGRFFGYGSQSNLGIGGEPLRYTTSGIANVAFGRGALDENINGDENVAYGVRALYQNGVGSHNTAVGHEALMNNTAGFNCTAVGYGALTNNIAGPYNTALGYGCLQNNTEGLSNVAIGVNVLVDSNTNYNIGIGSNALGTIGYTGSHNNAIGIDCARSITSAKYTQAVGYETMFNLTSGDGNDGFGHQTLRENTTGSHNSAFGYQALTALVGGSNNVAFGPSAAAGQTAGSGNIAIGNTVALPSLTGSNQLNIGNTIYGDLALDNVGVGVLVPLAAMHLRAGTATANTAPLKFTTGTNLTAPEQGVMEYSTGRLLFTDTDATRRHIVQAVNATKTVAGAPYVNDGYVTVTINGTSLRLMTTA